MTFNRVTRSVSAALVWVAVALLSAPNVCDAQDDAPLPTPRAGTQWIYENEVVGSDAPARPASRLTVLSTNGTIAHCEAGPLDTGQTQTLDFDYARYASTAAPAGLVMLKFPLKPGDHWQDKYRYTRPIPGHPEARTTIDALAETSVGQWETLTVPAGTYRVLRVERNESESITGPGMGHLGRFSTSVSWYAPDVGRVVQMNTYTAGDPMYLDTADIASGRVVGTRIIRLREYRPGTRP
ncbi:hypothetical protein ACVBGC_31730 [Burkholderia stagnalis]